MALDREYDFQRAQGLNRKFQGLSVIFFQYQRTTCWFLRKSGAYTQNGEGVSHELSHTITHQCSRFKITAIWPSSAGFKIYGHDFPQLIVYAYPNPDHCCPIRRSPSSPPKPRLTAVPLPCPRRTITREVPNRCTRAQIPQSESFYAMQRR
jgi:hypothetical protein